MTEHLCPAEILFLSWVGPIEDATPAAVLANERVQGRCSPAKLTAIAIKAMAIPLMTITGVNGHCDWVDSHYHPRDRNSATLNKRLPMSGTGS